MLRQAAMWMSSHRTHESSFFFFMALLVPDQRETCCYAWHGTTAVTLTRNAPLSKAQGPGISVSRIEPSGVILSRFSLSSSRSLGRCLLLSQRSRMNLFSHHIRSLFHQDRRNPRTQFTSYRDNGDSGSYLSRMPSGNRAEKFPKLVVFSDSRPGALDEFAPKPAISRMGNRSAIGSISGRVLRGDHAQKPCQLADVFNLAPISDPGHQLARYNPADPGDAPQVLYTLGQFRDRSDRSGGSLWSSSPLAFQKTPNCQATDRA